MAGAPWERYRQPSAPAVNPVIAPPDPYRQANEQRAQVDQQLQIEAAERARQAEQRANEDQSLQREKFDLERQKTERTLARSPATESERTAAFLATRVASSSRQLSDAIVTDPSAQSPNLGVEIVRGIFGQTAANYINDEQRQQVENAQLDIIDAALTLGTGAAYTPEQLQTYRRSYFPQLGDSPATIADKGTRLRALLESARVKAGSAAPDIDRAISAIFPEQQTGRRDDAPPAFGAGARDATPGPTTPFVNAEGQVAGNTHNNDDGPTPQQLLDGEFRQEDDPLLAGVRQEYLARLGRGDSAESIIRWAREVGIHPSAYLSIGQQVRHHREHPEQPLSEYSTRELDDRFVEVDPLARGISNMGRNAIGPALIGAGDAASGFTLDNMTGNPEQARLGMEQIAAENPVSSTAGMVAGGTLAALGIEAGLGTKMAPGLARAMIADTAYGAAAGAGATDYGPDGQPATAVDRLVGAGKGALAGAGGSYAGAKVGNALAKLGRGVTDASVNALRQEGVNALTVGQTFANSGKAGKIVKGVEDRVAGLPVVGDMVNARRAEGVRQFNSRAFDKALEPIGGTVGDAVGEEAVERAQNAVSQAFRDALDGKGVVPDAAFETDLSAAVMGVRSIKRVGDEVTDEVADILAPYGDEVMLSGDALDDISRGLRDLKGRYRMDPLGVKVGKQLDRVERAVFDLFDRQASGTIDAYRTARQAYRRLSVLEDAVLKGKNSKGVFTPAQLGQADRRNAVRYGGKRAAARGEGVFHDYQRAAQDVLPNQVPDSGTAGRVLIPLALIGGGGGVDAAGGGGVGTGLTIGTILAALYSRTGQRILTKPGRGMKPGTTRRVLESNRTRRAIGAAGAAGSAAALTDQR